MSPPLSPSGAPRWPALLALAVGVLVAHVALIVGELPPGWLPSDPTPTHASGGSSVAASSPAAPATPGQATPARPRAVQVSQVRWIALPPPAEPVAQAAAPAPAAKRRAPVPVPQPPDAPAAASPPADTPTQDPSDSAPADLPTAPPPETTLAQATDALPAATGADASAPPPTDGAQANSAPAPGGAASDLVPAAQAAASADLAYDIQGQSKGLSYTADARLQWQNDGSRYSARLEITAFLIGSRVSTSVGSVGPQGLAPERYAEQGRRAERATHFDAADGRIRFSNNAPDAAWAPGAQDRLSLFLQLGALFRATPGGYPPDSIIGLLVAGTGSAEIWPFQVGPLETLKLPAGEVSAFRLLRPPRHTYDNTVEIWLAPALEHLPVRIRLSDQNGDVADQQLRIMPPVIQ